jgi:hypothetical protein
MKIILLFLALSQPQKPIGERSEALRGGSAAEDARSIDHALDKMIKRFAAEARKRS